MITYFTNKVSKEEVRWDPAQARTERTLLPGRAGINHWHRINTVYCNDKEKYLNAVGKPCSILQQESVIIPREQNNLRFEDIAYDENMLDTSSEKLIRLLDEKTTSWFHDSVIDDITVSDQSVDVSITQEFDSTIRKGVLKLIKSEQFIQDNITEYVHSEIYRILIRKSNMGNEIHIISSQNEVLIIFFDTVEYLEIT